MKKSWIKLLQVHAPEIFGKTESVFLKLLQEDFEEIMYNGWNQIYFEDSRGMQRLENLFLDAKDYEREVALFLASLNQRLSVDRSILNFSIGDKYRVQVLHRHISGSETIISFRQSGSGKFTAEDFYRSEFLSKKQHQILRELVENKRSIFICGETSSGKTTLLNFLLSEIDGNERLVVIEDTREILAPPGRNIVYLRSSRAEYQKEEITTGDLVKASLRLRPNRIILGEIRREEVVDFLHAINTGHKGSLCTGHGNSPVDMIHRLEMLLIEAGVPYDATKRYLGRGIDVICFLEGKSKRQLKTICRVDFIEGEVRLNEINESF